MKIKSTLLFIIILLGANINLFSQALTGCGKNGTGVIHYQRNGFGSGAGNTAKFKYNNIPFSTYSASTSICPRFTIYSLVVPTTNCCIETDCGSDLFLYNFTNIACPLDDYTLILLAAFGISGFVLIRRNLPELYA
jgi:hypothetical protein